MNRLKDLLEKKVKSRYDVDETKNTEEQEVQIKKYNKSWLMRTSGLYGYIVNRDREHADKILQALNRTDGHCPCGGNGAQYKCPCIYMRENGICRCGLFENITPVNPTGRSSAKIREDK